VSKRIGADEPVRGSADQNDRDDCEQDERNGGEDDPATFAIRFWGVEVVGGVIGRHEHLFFLQEEASGDQRVDARAEIASNSVTRRDNQRLSKKIERRVDKKRGGRGFTGVLQQFPEDGIIGFADDMKSGKIAGQEKASRKPAEESAALAGGDGHGGKEARVVRNVKVARRVFGGDG